MKKAHLHVITIHLLLLGFLGLGTNAAAEQEIYGVVRDAQTSAPVPFAEVFSMTDITYAFSDFGGNYRLPTLPGSHTILVYAPGYQVLLELVEVPLLLSIRHDFYLQPEPADTGQISGTVTDCRAQVPIINALVATDTGAYTFTEESGAFILDLYPGEHLVEIWSPGYVAHTLEVSVTAGLSDLGGICLQPESELGYLQGYVTDRQTGFPILFASVRTSDYSNFVFTGLDGYYFMVLPAGPVDLVVEASGYVTETISNVTIAADQTFALDIALNPIQGGDDHCNQPDACATLLEVNQEPVDGSTEATDDVDWFQFRGAAGVEYEIETSELGSGSDTLIYLYREDGTTLIDSDDDGGVGYASKIVWTADRTESLYVKVSQYSPSGTGTYRISVRGSDDHCNVPESCATEIQSNANPIPGRIGQGGDVDWFRFTAVSSSIYEIETLELGEDADTVLALYRSDGTTLIAQNDDGGEGFASKISWIADGQDTFYVVVRHFDPEGTGSYKVRLKEHDDHCNTATSCATYLPSDGTAIQGAFEIDEDEDWFGFQAIAGADYVIETGNLADDCDTVIILYGPDGSVIAFDDDEGVGVASKITFNAVDPGVHYVAVFHIFTTGRGTYEISLNGSDDHANTPDWATLVTTNGEPLAGNIEIAGDWDLFRFSAEGGRTYVIETGNLAGGCDTFIILYGPDGSVIAFDDDEGVGVASKITFDALDPGVYYVGVQHIFTFGTGSYEIGVLSQDDYPHPPGPDATVLPPDGTPVAGQFEAPGDEDWFRFEAAAGQGYIIETANLSEGCDTVMELYAQDGSTLIDTDDDGGEGPASRLEWTALLSGTIYVRLRHFSSSGTGSYHIHLRQVYSDDHGDTGASATPVDDFGTPFAGQIGSPGDADWFQFQAAGGMEYIIETSGLDERSDTVIELYDQDGSTLITADDDGGEGLGSRIVWRAEDGAAGTYYVRVFHFSSEGTGAYELVVQSISLPCTAVNPDELIEGALTEMGGSQLYCLNVQAGDEVTVNLSGPQSAADFDLYLQLGSPPTLSDYDVRGFHAISQETCELTASSSDILYIWVKSYTGQGDYSLQARVIPYVPPTCDLTLSEDAPQTGSLSGTGDGDLYCLAVGEGEQVLIILDGPADGADFDLYLKLGSPPTLSDYDARGHSPFSEEMAALSNVAQGTLYVRVVSYAGGGDYTLEARISPTQPGCVAITEGMLRSGNLSFTYDEQLYCFEVTAGDQFTVTLNGFQSGTDFDVFLKFGLPPTPSDFDAASTLPTSQEQIQFTASAGGTVYILVWSYSGSGQYTVQADITNRQTTGFVTKGTQSPGKHLLLKGQILNKHTAQKIQPNRFCVSIKNLTKVCYDSNPDVTSEISFLPGGYFLFTLPEVPDPLTCEITDIPCYKNMKMDFKRTQISNLTFEAEVDAAADCDQDGMNNAWEKQHGLNIWKNDARLDFDQDTYNNLEEYNAGSNPNDKSSIPQGLKAKGNINGDGRVDLVDAVIALQVLAGAETSGSVVADYASSGADVNGDSRIGMPEVIYILQKTAELRN